MNNAFALLAALLSRSYYRSKSFYRLLYGISPVLILSLFQAPFSMAFSPDKTTRPKEPATTTALPHPDNIDWPEDIIVLEEQNMVLYITTAGSSYKNSSRQLRLSARSFTNNTPLTTFGNKGSVTLEQFAKVDSAKGIVKDNNLYIAIQGSLKDTPDNPKLHILRFRLLSGVMDTSFAGNGIESLPTEKYGYISERPLLHNNRLLVTVQQYEGSRVYAINLETGHPDPHFAEAGQLSLSSDKAKGYVSKSIIDGDYLYIGASFARSYTQPETYSNRIAVCKVNLISGRIEAPFDCTSEASWLTSQYGHNNRIRAMALTSNGSLILGVDENTTKLPYEYSAAVLYSFNLTTGTLNHSFGTTGRLEITQPDERHMLRSVTLSEKRLLVNIERLSPNETGKLESPFSADKESAIYALDAHTGKQDDSFGDNSRLSLTGQILRQLTTRYAMLQPEQNRLLIVMDESIDNRELSAECKNMMDSVRKSTQHTSSQLINQRSQNYHVEFEHNISIHAKLTGEYHLYDIRWLNPSSNSTWLRDHLIQFCPPPEITRHLTIFAIDTKTGTLKQDFGRFNGKTIIRPKPNESLIAYKGHITTNGEIVLFNQLFHDDHNRSSNVISAILSPNGLSSHYPLVNRLPHYHSHAITHSPWFKATGLTLLMMGHSMLQHP